MEVPMLEGDEGKKAQELMPRVLERPVTTFRKSLKPLLSITKRLLGKKKPIPMPSFITLQKFTVRHVRNAANPTAQIRRVFVPGVGIGGTQSNLLLVAFLHYGVVSEFKGIVFVLFPKVIGN